MTADPHPHALIEADDSVLVVIDVQYAFLDKLPPPDAEQVLSKVCWLVKLAMWRGVPLVVTAEAAQDQPLARKLVDTLPADTRLFDKRIFGLAHQPDILTAVQATGRRTAVLVGLETDVCVAHSGLGLLELGYRVAVVTDATGSPEPGHGLGLSRLQGAGAIILNLKGLFYEWLRTLEAVQRFHREMPEMRNLAGTGL